MSLRDYLVDVAHRQSGASHFDMVVISTGKAMQVQPRLAVGRMRNSSLKVEAGDWVRFPVRPN